jgi:ABC-2 type transport system permease protein
MIVAAIRAEWFKVIRRPAMWVTVGLVLALSVGLEYVLVYAVATHPPATAARLGSTFTTLRVDLYPAAVIKKTLTNVSGLYGIFPLIVGVLVQGSEYSWGTVKTAHLQLPGRLAITGGQLVSISLLTLVMAVALFAVDAAASYGISTIDGKSSAWPTIADLAKGAGAAWLIFDFLAMLGYGLATAFKQSALAIGLGLGYVLVIENLVFGLLDNLGDTFKQIHEWFPVANAGYLEEALGALRAEASAGPPVDAVHAVAVLLVWLIGIVAIAAAIVQRRDII